MSFERKPSKWAVPPCVRKVLPVLALLSLIAATLWAISLQFLRVSPLVRQLPIFGLVVGGTCLPWLVGTYYAAPGQQPGRWRIFLKRHCKEFPSWWHVALLTGMSCYWWGLTLCEGHLAAFGRVMLIFTGIILPVAAFLYLVVQHQCTCRQAG